MGARRFLGAVACVVAMSSPREAAAQWAMAPASDDLDRARALDQQGVRAFREARYNDAIRYFEEALKLGGPSSELWNSAK
jgi:Flp pilus assembly protein TadD